MRVVSVLVLVLWLGGARACLGPAVRVSGLAGAHRSVNQEYYWNELEAHYGDTVNIFCSSDDSKNLSIKRDDGHTDGQVTEVNTTTLQLSVELVFGAYDYTCTNAKTDCAAKLRVYVVPVITVVSPNVHQKSFRHYFVPIDENFELVCSGNPELEIVNRHGTNMEIISVNETTIKSEMVQGTKYSTNFFSCRHRASGLTSDVLILFDYIPAATDFWCTEDDWQVTCTWSVLSKDTTFTLFYTDKDGNSMRIYEDFLGNKKTRRCEWNLEKVPNRNLAISAKITFVVQACNPIYCSNQTYVTDHKSITKTGPPGDLELLKTTSHTATVTWRGPWLQDTNYYFDIPVEYKLIFRLLGENDLSGSSTQITCDHRSMRYPDKCEGKLNISCPGALYEVEVYSKFTSTPRTNDAYWSEPARITIRTDPTSSSDTVDPACLKEPELIDNKYIAVHEIKKLLRSFRREGSVLHRKVKSMERKVDEIKDYVAN